MVRTLLVATVVAGAAGSGCHTGDSVDPPDPDEARDAGGATAADASDAPLVDAGPAVGPSGLSSERPLGGLSGSEQLALCSWQIALHGGEGHVIDCGDEGDIVVGTVQECVDRIPRFAACQLRVAEIEACAIEFEAMPCDVTLGGACDPLFLCPAL